MKIKISSAQCGYRWAVGGRFIELFYISTHPYSSGAASAAALKAVMASVIGRAAPRMTGVEEIWR